MTLNFDPPAVPLHADADGTIRVSRTRVTLDSVVGSFLGGATPEEIAQDFSSLSLGDVYAVIAFYLKNRPEVDAHLHEYRQRGEELQRQMEERFDPAGLRARLLARRRETA